MKKVAIVYDWMDSWGGVERVLLELHALYPEAIFYTSYYDPQKATWAKELKIVQSFIQYLPGFIKKHRKLSLPLYPFAFESFDFTGFDLVISVTSSFAKGVITRPEAQHICYMLTPPRFIWGQENTYMRPLLRFLSKPYRTYIKKWDTIASTRPDNIVAISKTVSERIEKYYGLESDYLYPPFDIDYWKNLADKDLTDRDSDYYLIVSRLEPYKKVDLVIKLFNKLQDKKLIIIGTGTQERALKSMARKNITFIKNLSDSQVADYYKHAKALIMPQEEDFGYVSLEAQACGCPVIAYRKGGATETVIENETGIFFDKQTIESLSDAIEKYERIQYDLKETMKKVARHHLTIFDRKHFEKKFSTLLDNE